MASEKEKSLKPQRWLRWVHRIGYVTTALIAAQLLLIAFLGTREWLENRERRAAQIEESRTYEGPLRAADGDIVQESAAYLLRQLPPLEALHGDGLRFVAMPSFNEAHFAVAISLPKPDAIEAEGIVARFNQYSRYAPLGQRQFRMPAAAYRSLTSKLDTLTDGWPGEETGCVDGTPIAFERVRGARVTSGIGNCVLHYEQLGQLMWNYLHRFAPADDLPSEGDWHAADK